MVAAILLQKKRLVDILEEACDLDPLNAVGGDLAGGAGASSSQLTAANGLGVVAAVTNSPTTSSKRRRNSLTSRLNACSKASSSLYHSSSFASDSSSTTDPSSATTSKVRFATSRPQVRYFSNYLPSMTEKEREQVRTSIWYTRDEFESFLQDRIHTIRVWRSLGGGDDNDSAGKDTILMSNHRELGEHYCPRGLEPYQSPARNAEMHSLRNLYTASILNEQDRLHALYEGKHDPFLVAGQVAHLSHRAMHQARLLALQDEKDAKEHNEPSHPKHRKRLSNGAPANAHRRKSSMSRRHTMNHTSSTSTNGTSGARLAAPLSLSPPSTTRNKVDVTLLKEMNAQFLQTLMANRQASSALTSSSSSSSLSAPSGSTKLDGKDADMGPGFGGGTMALSSLMWNAGHPAARHLQMMPPATAPVTTMMRRHSLDLDANVERNEAIMSQPFLAIRRDSLHCLLSTAASASHTAQTQPS